MAFNIDWNVSAKKLFERGVDRVVLYPRGASGYEDAVAWEGVTNVTESPEGAEANALYAENVKYTTLISPETFKGKIEAFTYPDEWEACDGSLEADSGIMMGQQSRKGFGLSYRTQLGSDAVGEDLGYKIHVLYGCLASPTEKARATIAADANDASTFSWDFESTPVSATGFKPVSKITFDSTKLTANGLAALEDSLYGVDATPGALLLPDALIALVQAAS